MGNKIIIHSKPTLGKDEETAVVKVIRSGQITQGKKVAQFERVMASYIGKKYAIAVNSGLSALHLSLIALGIKKDDEVILPSYTCDALLNAVLYLDAKPEIVDVNYSDGNISPIEIKRKITSKTKAIIVPHCLGFPAEIDSIIKLGIPVIEDCAVSIGAKYKSKMVGSFGKISVFSFYATKMLTTGEGGMILTNDKKIADIVRELRDYTKHAKFRIRYNYKMTDIEAAMGIVQLRKLNFFIKKRFLLAKKYTDLLKECHGIVLPIYNKKEIKPVFYRYIVKLLNHNPNKIRRIMRKKGIVCGLGVLKPLHQLLRLSPKHYPVSEKLTREVISLPIYPSLTEKDIKYIVRRFINALRNSK